MTPTRNLIDTAASLTARNPFAGTEAEDDYDNVVRVILYPHDGPVDSFEAICRAFEAASSSVDVTAEALHDCLKAIGALTA